jgi:nucleotide-binding universal stress UspA family protein
VYEHIVVPFDGTNEAQRAGMVGADLAQLFGAELVLATAADLEGDELEELKAAAQRRSDTNATVWIEPNPSDTEAIRTVVAHRPHSLVCLHSSGRVGVRRAVYGNFAERLLNELDVPVLVLGPRCDQSSVVNLRNLLVCVDGSPTSDAALAIAIAWARVLPLNASLVHIRRKASDEVDLRPAVQALETCCEVVDQIDEVHDDRIDAVVEIAWKSSNAMLVMATHGRTALQRALQGSFTADMIHRSPLPVLVQRGPLPAERPEWLTPRG